MQNNKHKNRVEELLDVLFALPSDVERSDDEFEDEDRNSSTNSSRGVESLAAADIYPHRDDSDVDSIVSADSCTLYRLAMMLTNQNLAALIIRNILEVTVRLTAMILSSF